MIIKGRLFPTRTQRSLKIRGREVVRPLFNSHEYCIRRRTILMVPKWITLASSHRQTFKRRRWYQYNLRNEDIAYPNFLQITWCGRRCARLEHADRRYQKRDIVHQRFARWHNRRLVVARRSRINAIEERLTGQQVRLRLTQLDLAKYVLNVNTRYGVDERYNNYLHIECIAWLSKHVGRIIDRECATLYGQHWRAEYNMDTHDSNYIIYDVTFSEEVDRNTVFYFLLKFG